MNYSDEQRARDYRVAFGSPEGQRVLADLLAACHVLTPIRPDDPIAMAYAEGERNVALRITSYLHYTPEQFRRLPQQVEDAFSET